MPFDDALAVLGEVALAAVGLEHGRFRLLDLQEQWIGLVLAEQQDDPASCSDAPDTDDLAGVVGHAEALEQMLAVVLQGTPVGTEPLRQPGAELVGLGVGQQLA